MSIQSKIGDQNCTRKLPHPTYALLRFAPRALKRHFVKTSPVHSSSLARRHLCVSSQFTQLAEVGLLGFAAASRSDHAQRCCLRIRPSPLSLYQRSGEHRARAGPRGDHGMVACPRPCPSSDPGVPEAVAAGSRALDPDPHRISLPRPHQHRPSLP